MTTHFFSFCPDIWEKRSIAVEHGDRHLKMLSWMIEKDKKDNVEQETNPDERSEVQNGNSKGVNDKEDQEVIPDEKEEIQDLEGTDKKENEGY